jgi:hypothetical protein
MDVQSAKLIEHPFFRTFLLKKSLVGFGERLFLERLKLAADLCENVAYGRAKEK